MKLIYGLCCVLGITLPYWQFLPWLLENGLDLPLLLQQAFHSRISAFAWLDVIVSGIVLIAFILYEGMKQKMTLLWIPIVATLTIGVSFGLPLFLLMREIQTHPTPLNQN